MGERQAVSELEMARELAWLGQARAGRGRVGARESTPSPEPRAGTRRETKLSADWPSTCKKIPGALTQRLRNWGPPRCSWSLRPSSTLSATAARAGKTWERPWPKELGLGARPGAGRPGGGAPDGSGAGDQRGSPIWGLWKPPWGSCVGKALKGVTVPSHKHKHEGAS